MEGEQAFCDVDDVLALYVARHCAGRRDRATAENRGKSQ